MCSLKTGSNEVSFISFQVVTAVPSFWIFTKKSESILLITNYLHTVPLNVIVTTLNEDGVKDSIRPASGVWTWVWRLEVCHRKSEVIAASFAALFMVLTRERIMETLGGSEFAGFT